MNGYRMFPLNYQASDDIMLYASVGRGFKAGGFNALTPQSTPYDPEESTTYEVGLKSELFDRILLLNVAAFSTDTTTCRWSSGSRRPLRIWKFATRLLRG